MESPIVALTAFQRDPIGAVYYTNRLFFVALLQLPFLPRSSCSRSYRFAEAVSACLISQLSSRPHPFHPDICRHRTTAGAAASHGFEAAHVSRSAPAMSMAPFSTIFDEPISSYKLVAQMPGALRFWQWHRGRRCFRNGSQAPIGLSAYFVNREASRQYTIRRVSANRATCSSVLARPVMVSRIAADKQHIDGRSPRPYHPSPDHAPVEKLRPAALAAPGLQKSKENFRAPRRTPSDRAFPEGAARQQRVCLTQPGQFLNK